MRVRTSSLFVVFIFLALGACKSSNSGKAAGDSNDWSMHGGNYREQQFSPLKQINSENVDKLGLVWSHEFGTHRGLEATPLVENGVIYTTVEWSVVYAIDALTGQVCGERSHLHNSRMERGVRDRRTDRTGAVDI